MRDRGLGGEPRVGAAQIVAHAGQPHREALDVRLVDHRLVPRRVQPAVALPVEPRVDHDALRDRVGVVLVVELEVGVLLAGRHVRQHVAGVVPDRALDRLRVRVDQQLAGVEAVTLRRRVRPGDAEPVALARPDQRQVAVPVQRGPLGQVDALLVAVVGVEQAQLHAGRVLGEQREVRAAAVPRRAERERLAGPDLPHRTTAPASGASAPSRSSPATSTGSPSSGHGCVAEVGEDPVRAAPHGQAAAVALRPRLRAGQLRAQRQRGRVDVSQSGRLARAGELGRRERGRVLRVGHLAAELGERGELAPPPLAGRGRRCPRRCGRRRTGTARPRRTPRPGTASA